MPAYSFAGDGSTVPEPVEGASFDITLFASGNFGGGTLSLEIRPSPSAGVWHTIFSTTTDAVINLAYRTYDFRFTVSGSTTPVINVFVMNGALRNATQGGA